MLLLHGELLKTSGFRHEVLERELASLMLPVDSPRQEQQRGEPKRGAQRNKHNNHWFWNLDGVHGVLGFEK